MTRLTERLRKEQGEAGKPHAVIAPYMEKLGYGD